MEVEIKKLAAVARNIKPGSDDDREFERRVKTAELLLKEREIASKEAIVAKQMQEDNNDANTNRNTEVTRSDQQPIRLPQ